MTRMPSRGRTGLVLTTLIAAGVVVGGIALSNAHGDDDSHDDPDTGTSASSSAGSPSPTAGPANATSTADPDAEGYAAWGAYGGGDLVTLGSSTKTLARPPVHVVQTSAGAVAQLYEDGASTFVLVRPGAYAKGLSIPGGTPTIDADINAPRVAWLVSGTDEVTVHVWDVTTDREVGSTTIDLPGARPQVGRQSFQPVVLDGPTVYVGLESGSARAIRWATGTSTEVDYAPLSAHQGVGTARDDEGSWHVIDVATAKVTMTLGRDVLAASVSPNGRWVLVVPDDDSPAFVRPVQAGSTDPDDTTGRVEVAEITAESTWTPDGHLLGPGGAEYTVRRCSVDGTCAERQGAGVGPGSPVLIADFLHVG